MQVPVLIGILSTLLNQDVVTGQELAEKYEVSARTVYRYVDVLSQGGVPISTRLGRHGGWSIDKAYKLKASYLTPAEYERMLFCVEASTLQDATTKSVVDKLRLIGRAANARMNTACPLLVDSDKRGHLQEKIEKIQQANAEHRLLYITYHAKGGEVTERTIEPYCLVLQSEQWYVYSYCHLRCEFRYFKLMRIAEMNVLSGTFFPREYEVNTDELEDVNQGKESVEVLLSVNKAAFTTVEEWLGIGNVSEVGGKYYARAVLPYDDALVSKILSFGRDVIVEKPTKLANALVRLAEEVVWGYRQ
jgi:predicted DNA-binding transcriptional regulator YafY